MEQAQHILIYVNVDFLYRVLPLALVSFECFKIWKYFFSAPYTCLRGLHLFSFFPDRLEKYRGKVPLPEAGENDLQKFKLRMSNSSIR
jgi:hypothetical protein